jgi:hypothetical protein
MRISHRILRRLCRIFDYPATIEDGYLAPHGVKLRWSSMTRVIHARSVFGYSEHARIEGPVRIWLSRPASEGCAPSQPLAPTGSD